MENLWVEFIFVFYFYIFLIFLNKKKSHFLLTSHFNHPRNPKPKKLRTKLITLSP